jgi:PIN domain nuclease of toxin-antitoxin system
MPEPKPEPIVLDTHMWIWLMEGDPRLGRSDLVTQIERVARVGELYVSAVSVWEVAMLEALGRVRFTMPCFTWLSEALETPGLRMVPLSAPVALDSARLPGEFTGDPADRIIVATARALGALLATADTTLLAYSDAGFVRAAGV